MKKRFFATVIAATLLLTACSSGGSKTADERPTPYREGDYIVFGHYEQDGDKRNGPEPIEWEIVKEENGRMLLVSRYILDLKPYNEEVADVTWETCSLRSWLNNEFVKEAFNESEQEKLITATITNPDNNFYKIKGGNDTEDKVFCLSVEEILKNYKFEKWNEEESLGSCKALRIKPTKYAEKKYPYVLSEGTMFWWLRSPGNSSTRACDVGSDGGAGWSYSPLTDNNDGLGVRPAIYLNSL